MATRHKAVFGIYASVDIAENAVDQLLKSGFTNSDISVLLPDDESTRAFAHEKNTKAPEGVTAGAATGGVIGGTLGVLAGIGALAIPGIGPLIASGPIIAALAGIGAGGTLGGFVGALVGMGIPEYEAKRFEGAVRNGGTLLSVHCDTSQEITRAKQTLRDTGARDIAATGEEGTRAEEPSYRPRGSFEVIDRRDVASDEIASDSTGTATEMERTPLAERRRAS